MDPRSLFLVTLAVACCTYAHSLRAEDVSAGASSVVEQPADSAASQRSDAKHIDPLTVQRKLAARNAAIEQFNQSVSSRPVQGFTPGNTSAFCVPR